MKLSLPENNEHANEQFIRVELESSFVRMINISSILRARKKAEIEEDMGKACHLQAII